MNTAVADFHQRYTGRFWSVMSWDQLTAFWQRVDASAGWYLYALGEAPPAQPADGTTVEEFMRRIDALLRHEHHESYCGIVYADDLEAPEFVKIYDPNNLGTSCGSGKHPHPPGWVMCRIQPAAVEVHRPAPEGRRRWWQALLGD